MGAAARPHDELMPRATVVGEPTELAVVASMKAARASTVKILVSSPTDNRTQHAALAHAVKAIMEGVLPAASGFTVGGFRTKAHATAVTDDDRWLTTIEGILGVDWTPVDNPP